jgi:hypothetical protein
MPSYKSETLGVTMRKGLTKTNDSGAEATGKITKYIRHALEIVIKFSRCSS